MLISSTRHKKANTKQYFTGEKENRPWGFFEVLDVGIKNGEEFCEKIIGVKPMKALSLQRHRLRRETWRVEQGELTVVLNGNLHKLTAGQTIEIPLKAPHCMINTTNEMVVVNEIQMGICREADNDRLCDSNGRDVVDIMSIDIEAIASKEIYEKIVKSMI